MQEIPMPAESLCHYTRADTAFSHIIPSGKLKMNPYGKMRDPFENKHPYLRSLSGWTPPSADPADADEGDAQAAMFWEVQGHIARSRDAWVLLSLTRYDDRGGLDDRWGTSRLIAPRGHDRAFGSSTPTITPGYVSSSTATR